MEVLRQHWIEIRERYGVESLALFGSVSRDEAQQQSDVDLLVKFVHPPGFDVYRFKILLRTDPQLSR